MMREASFLDESPLTLQDVAKRKFEAFIRRPLLVTARRRRRTVAGGGAT
jgi:hypothetical protein